MKQPNPILCKNCGKTEEEHQRYSKYCIKFGFDKFEPQEATMKQPKPLSAEEKCDICGSPIDFEFHKKYKYLEDYPCDCELQRIISEHQKEVEEVQKALDIAIELNNELRERLSKILSVIDEIQAQAERKKKANGELLKSFKIANECNIIIATCKQIKERIKK